MAFSQISWLFIAQFLILLPTECDCFVADPPSETHDHLVGPPYIFIYLNIFDYIWLSSFRWPTWQWPVYQVLSLCVVLTPAELDRQAGVLWVEEGAEEKLGGDGGLHPPPAPLPPHRRPLQHVEVHSVQVKNHCSRLCNIILTSIIWIMNWWFIGDELIGDIHLVKKLIDCRILLHLHPWASYGLPII